MLINISPSQLTDKPAAAVAQTCDRANAFSVTGAVTSGAVHLVGIPLNTGDVVTSITFISGTTALAGGSHLWAALFDPSRVLLGQSVNDTSPTWSASSAKTFTLGTPVLITLTGWYYVGLLCVASTMPTMLNVNPGTAVTALPPIRHGDSTTGLTATAPNPAAAPSGGTLYYAYVS